MKTTADIKGATLVEGPKEYGYSNSTGWYTIRTWKATTEDELYSKAAELENEGYDWAIKQGPLWTLTAKIPTNTDSSGAPVTENPIPIFEIIPQRKEQDLLFCDAAIMMVLRPELKRMIHETISNNNPPSFLTASYNASIYKNASEKEMVSKVYTEYLAGVNSFPSFWPIVRKTYICSNKYVLNESVNYVNRVYSKNTLISAEAVPSTIWGLMPESAFKPSNTYNSNLSYPANNIGSAIDLVVGYLKSWPTYTQVGRNQYQVTVEYAYGSYSYFLFGSLL